MKKYLLLLVILNSCSKIGNAYKAYKKTLGLDEKGSYLLANNNYEFINTDVKVDYQVFDELSDESLSTIEENITIDKNIVDKEIKPIKVDEDFIRNLALFENERSGFSSDNERIPASVATNDNNSYLIAQSYIKKGLFKKAEKELKAYIHESPFGDHAYSSYLNLAELKIQDKKYLEALNYYTEIFINKYDKIDSELLYSKLHYLYLKLGKKELALNYKKKLEARYPESNYLKTIK